MKTCGKCGESKAEDDFPTQKRSNKSGTQKYTVRRSECRICYNEYMKVYLSGRSSHKQSVKKSKQDKRDFVKKLKLEMGCSKCGYKKCSRALHFHHLDPKEKKFEIGWATTRGASLVRLRSEIAKCVLLCSNCHCEEEERLSE